MVADGKNVHPIFLCLFKLFICPPERFHLKLPFYHILRLILAGIQHQETISLIQLIDIAQRSIIPADSLVVAVHMVNIVKFFRRHRICLCLFLTEIHGCMGIVDIMVSGNNKYRNPGVLYPHKPSGQLLMVYLFPIHGDIAA